MDIKSGLSIIHHLSLSFDLVIGIKLICEGSAKEKMAWQVDIHENNNISGLVMPPLINVGGIMFSEGFRIRVRRRKPHSEP
jgi:hypothetical protein